MGYMFVTAALSAVAGLVVFALAVPLGYFLCWRCMHRTSLLFFFAQATDLETKWRDRALRPLTRRMRGVSPNAVTIVGFLLTAALVWLFWVRAALGLIFIGMLLAGLTDMLDGPLARNNGRVTALGAKLDWWRDLALTIVIGVALVLYNILAMEFLVWFLTGWAALGVLRMAEFRAAGGTVFTEQQDYKFILDRVRLVLIWIAVLLLVLARLTPALSALTAVGNALTLAAIAASWVSVLLHAAHLRMLKKV